MKRYLDAEGRRRRCNLDLDAGKVNISRKFAELRYGRRVAGPPKSAAGVRVVALPAMLVA
jgi:hypothetical protein